MSVNTAHANNGVLIHAGEYILLHSDSVTMEFSGQDNPVFKGTKTGRIYLTSHRMIFNSKKSDAMMSFSAPFIALSDVELEQPVFGANYIKGKVRAQPNGNYIGEVKFKLYFKAGGAIEYGQTLLRAARTAQGNLHREQFGDDPPPYTPSGSWHEAPPPAYQPPPGYYGWVPTHDAFSGPAPNTVFMSDNPPPYPGIGPVQQNVGPAPTPADNHDAASWHAGYPMPAGQPQQPGQFQQQPQQWGGGYQPPPYGTPSYGGPPGYASAPMYGPAGGYAAPGYGAPNQGAPGYGAPPQATGPDFRMPADCNAPPYAQSTPGGYPAPGYPNAQNCYPYAPAGSGAVGGGGGAMGFCAPPANSKEAEAMAGGFNNPNINTRASDEPPPNYQDATTRKNQ